MRPIVVGTRKSALAVKQTENVVAMLRAAFPEYTFEMKKVVTKGDRVLDRKLAEIGGKGLFVKEIEKAMLADEIDIAVHSMKDMPSVLPEELTIAAIPMREDHRDVLISADHQPFMQLKEGAVVGTSSPRRAAQLMARRSDIHVQMIRGNIGTRLEKLHQGTFDAIVLAASGLQRMGWSEDVVTEYLSADICLSAVGQGALALQCQADRPAIVELLQAVRDDETEVTVRAERAFLYELEGGCKTPIAAYATYDRDGLSLTGLVASTDGRTILQDEVQGSDAQSLGKELARRLLQRGARKILDEAEEEISS